MTSLLLFRNCESRRPRPKWIMSSFVHYMTEYHIFNMYVCSLFVWYIYTFCRTRQQTLMKFDILVVCPAEAKPPLLESISALICEGPSKLPEVLPNLYSKRSVTGNSAVLVVVRHLVSVQRFQTVECPSKQWAFSPMELPSLSLWQSEQMC